MNPRLPEFSSCEHVGGYGRNVYTEDVWETDFTTIPPRLYKEPVRGLRVYQNGPIQLRTYLFRNPDVRHTLHADFGMDIGLIRRRTGYNYFLPDRTPVTKEAVVTDLSYGYMLYDHNHGMVLRPAAYSPDEDEAIAYYSKGARPVGGLDFVLRVVDEEAYNWNLEKTRAARDFALAYVSLVDTPLWVSRYRKQPYLIRNYLRQLCAGDTNRIRQDYTVPDEEDNRDVLVQLGMMEKRSPRLLSAFIRRMSTRRVVAPFLYFTKEVC